MESTGLGLSAPCLSKFGKNYCMYMNFLSVLCRGSVCNMWSMETTVTHVRHRWFSHVCMPFNLLLLGGQHTTLQCLYRHNVVLSCAPLYPSSSTLSTELLKQRTKVQQLTKIFHKISFHRQWAVILKDCEHFTGNRDAYQCKCKVIPLWIKSSLRY